MNVSALAPNSYMPIPVETVIVTRETCDVKTFRFEPSEPGRTFTYATGQFVIISILGVGECPISISSSPGDGPWVELTVRSAGLVTAALHHGPPKGALGIRGPFGNGFDLDALKGRPVIMVAGGIGLAPLRSLVRFVEASRREFGPVAVLYGARTPEERLYKDEIEKWRRTPGMTVQEIVERDPDSNWQGRLGRVTELFGSLGEEFKGAAAVLCGPHPMVGPVVHALEGLGIPAADIQVALEGRMNCGVGKCGHCYVGDKLVCADGPVFTADILYQMGGIS